jgi:hypothetical protein
MEINQIETRHINWGNYHPEQKWMAIFQITPTRFEVRYGRTKQMAKNKLLKILKIYGYRFKRSKKIN